MLPYRRGAPERLVARKNEEKQRRADSLVRARSDLQRGQSAGGAVCRGRDLSYACTLRIERNGEIMKTKILAAMKLPDVSKDVAEQVGVEPNAPQKARGWLRFCEP